MRIHIDLAFVLSSSVYRLQPQLRNEHVKNTRRIYSILGNLKQ